MIVTLSALGEQRVLRPMITTPCRSREPSQCRPSEPRDAALLNRATRRAPACWQAPAGATRRPGRLITTFHLWTTLRPVWTT